MNFGSKPVLNDLVRCFDFDSMLFSSETETGYLVSLKDVDACLENLDICISSLLNKQCD